MMKLSMMHGLCYHIWVRQTVFLLVVHSHHTTQKIWHNSLPHLLQHEGFFSEMLMWLPHGILTDNIILSDRARCSCLFGSLWFGISRWHTIRSPKLWQTEQSFRSNKVNSISKPYILCNYQNDVRKIGMLIALFSTNFLYHTHTFSWLLELVFWSQSVHTLFTSSWRNQYSDYIHYYPY